jgi:hypothetical protein
MYLMPTLLGWVTLSGSESISGSGRGCVEGGWAFEGVGPESVVGCWVVKLDLIPLSPPTHLHILLIRVAAFHD